MVGLVISVIVSMTILIGIIVWLIFDCAEDILDEEYTDDTQ